MKVLVLGGSGMAGHTIALYFQKQNHNVEILSRRKVDYCNTIVGDATDYQELEKLILDGNYDAVINAIGILNQFAEEDKANAVALNSYLPHFLSKITENTSTKIVHMSTDCVFSGKEGNYSEKSLRDGEKFYDRSKALGELNNSKDITLRTSIIGPDIKETGIGLFNWFMKQDGQLKGFTNAIWTGVTTLTLAKAMEKAIIEDLNGLYNLVNNNKINKFELLKLFNKHFKDNELDIIPFENEKVDKSLVNTRDDFSFNVPPYEHMIIEMKEWVIENKEIYSHYKI